MKKFLDTFKKLFFYRKKRYQELERRLKAAEFEGYIDSCALAVLSEEVIKISENGKIPEIFKNSRPAVRWALERVQYRHAWVVCGPGGGMKEFLEEMDKDSRFAIWKKYHH